MLVRLLRRSLAPYRRTLALVIVLLLIQAFGQLYLPNLNASIINNGVLTGDTGYILRIGALMLLVTAVFTVAAIVAVYYSARTAMRFGRDVRGDLFAKVQSFALREVNTFTAPSLITRNTNDVQQVQMLVVMGLTTMISAPIVAVGGVIMAVKENVQLSALLLLIIPVMLIVIGSIVLRAVPQFTVMQDRIDRINLVLREKLSGIRVIRAFVRTDYERQRFADANDALTDTSLRVARLFALMMPSLSLILNMAVVGVLWFGGHLVDSGSMPVGNLTAFIAYVMQILTSVMMAVMMVVMIPRASASADRIQEVLDTEPAIREVDDPSTVVPSRGVVELRDVDFRYPGAEQPVLHAVSFTCRPGEVTAIVGSTGVGKTTAINLMTRLYDTTGGAVLIDGVDVRDLPFEVLWSCFGLVPQKAFLFSGTIATNLQFGRPGATEEEMWAALETAQAAAFVRELPDGLHARIDQGGANFSGGQRQRLAIARALVREPLIAIFDDSFSALDFTTDANLRRALKDRTSHATVIIVAQRVNTVMQADQIVVLDDGQVVGTGTHHELMQTCETYQEIVSSQLSAAEAA
ncbi:MAG: ABC transporter ATP-binding protein [Candidatus Nanopelagicales bacterium]|nr:ABC transporter ATP-binding protein [Candidatus Nanopelagicales bacterium]